MKYYTLVDKLTAAGCKMSMLDQETISVLEKLANLSEEKKPSPANLKGKLLRLVSECQAFADSERDPWIRKYASDAVRNIIKNDNDSLDINITKIINYYNIEAFEKYTELLEVYGEYKGIS